MSTDNRNLSGKLALVTGGSRGIGAGIAVRLAADGAAVAITYRSSAAAADALVRKIESAGGRAAAFAADAGDRDSAMAAAARAVELLGGKLDVLVNNAGVSEINLAGPDADAAFERMLDVNVRGVWYTTVGALEHLNDGGRIINLGSIAGVRMPFGGAAAYAMSKHAVAGLTKGWARDLAPRRITVNTVQPGLIDTDMMDDLAAGGAAAGMADQLVPLKRLGTAADVAGLVAYLASADAAYVTGAGLTIDGGMIV